MQWLHYAEGSAMLPVMLKYYVRALNDAGAALHPRIDSELANHLGFINKSLRGRRFFVGDSLTGADIQMSFVAEAARLLGNLADYEDLSAWIDQIHERPAWKAAIKKGGPYNMGA